MACRKSPAAIISINCNLFTGKVNIKIEFYKTNSIFQFCLFFFFFCIRCRIVCSHNYLRCPYAFHSCPLSMHFLRCQWIHWPMVRQQPPPLMLQRHHYHYLERLNSDRVALRNVHRYSKSSTRIQRRADRHSLDMVPILIPQWMHQQLLHLKQRTPANL